MYSKSVSGVYVVGPSEIFQPAILGKSADAPGWPAAGNQCGPGLKLQQKPRRAPPARPAPPEDPCSYQEFPRHLAQPHDIAHPLANVEALCAVDRTLATVTAGKLRQTEDRAATPARLRGCGTRART